MSDEHAHPHAFPWRLMGLVAIIVIASSVVAGFFLQRDRVEPSAPVPSSIFTPAPDLVPVEKTRQLTILLTVRDQARQAVSNVLLGVGGDTGFVAELLLPRGLLLPTVPPIALKDATDPTGSKAAQQPLEVLLGVQIDATLDLDRLAWVGLIDAIGVGVDPVQAENAGSFPLVLDRVLAGLPVSEERVGQILTSLGSMARTTVPNEDVSHLLAETGRNLRTKPARRQVLPVTFVRSGPARVAIVRQADAEAVIAELFPKARLQPGHSGLRRAVIERAGVSLGGAVGARLALDGAGFGAVLAQAPAPTAQTSVVYVPGTSAAALTAGQDAAGALGLPPSAVAVDPDPEAVVDVRIVLGRDYAPM